MALELKPGTSWHETYARCVAAAPEAFDSDRLRNLVDGEWQRIGTPGQHVTPVDGSPIQGPPRISYDEAVSAVEASVRHHRQWSAVDLDERKARVSAAVDAMVEHRDLLALLLVWEIGKPWRLACADVDRALDGVRWYVEQIDRQLDGRMPLPGPVSNIASWNYPMSVQVHAELVQCLAGNAVVAKTPSQGGFHCLTLAHALMARAGLPVTLVSGVGGQLGDALIRGEGIGALAFVGGRANGRKAATSLADTGRRHFLEQEGLNAWGVWDFSDWDGLAAHLKKGFEYAKQRCTAYPRYVVQRQLFSEFLAAYLPVVASLRFGHPLAVDAGSTDFPELDFGPLISADKAADLAERYDEAVNGGAIPITHRTLAEGRFLEQQDISAYIAPSCILEPPPSWSLRHSEPFGPLDSIVIVDTEAELIAAMNASNGSLVASIATDDSDVAARVAEEVASFKFGVNKPRSRGDREETFGGRGASWKGAFVGGDLLVSAVTVPADGGEDRIYGNFPSYSLYPPPDPMLRLPLYDAYPIENLVLPLGDVRWRRSNLDPIEQATLLALVALREPLRIFEIGTYDGSTTRRLAAAAPSAHIWTLDLSPELAGASTEPGTREHAVAGLVGSAFHDTPESGRITQIFSDSRLFDASPLAGSMDLVIVDAGHELEFARADSATAFTLRAPGGVIVWDDYEDYWPQVQQAINELPSDVLADCVHIANTGMAVYDPQRST